MKKNEVKTLDELTLTYLDKQIAKHMDEGWSVMWQHVETIGSDGEFYTHFYARMHRVVEVADAELKTDTPAVAVESPAPTPEPEETPTPEEKPAPTPEPEKILVSPTAVLTADYVAEQLYPPTRKFAVGDTVLVMGDNRPHMIVSVQTNDWYRLDDGSLEYEDMLTLVGSPTVDAPPQIRVMTKLDVLLEGLPIAKSIREKGVEVTLAEMDAEIMSRMRETAMRVMNIEAPKYLPLGSGVTGAEVVS